MKYRIKYVIGLGYFAQVRVRWYRKWETIGKHTVGTGLYPEDHITYPMEKMAQARALASRHNAEVMMLAVSTDYTPFTP